MPFGRRERRDPPGTRDRYTAHRGKALPVALDGDHLLEERRPGGEDAARTSGRLRRLFLGLRRSLLLSLLLARTSLLLLLRLLLPLRRRSGPLLESSEPLLELLSCVKLAVRRAASLHVCVSRGSRNSRGEYPLAALAARVGVYMYQTLEKKTSRNGKEIVR